jgi:hypothetical protein
MRAWPRLDSKPVMTEYVDPERLASRLSNLVQAIVEQTQRERCRRIERAILDLAEHGQRVEELWYHLDANNLELRCELIVAGDVAHTVDLADLRPGASQGDQALHRV